MVLAMETVLPCAILCASSTSDLVLAGEIEMTETEIDHFYSTWVRRNIIRVSKLLGVTFEGFDQQAMALFVELEKRMLKKKKRAESTSKPKRKMIEGGIR